MKQPSQRQLRVAEQVRSIISETLHRGHFHDALLVKHANEITVSGVDIAPDLKSAKVFVMSLNRNDLPSLLTPLNHVHGYFQSAINSKLNIKFTPKLHFIEDPSFAEAERIESLLRKINE